jgi:hypothetical protein
MYRERSTSHHFILAAAWVLLGLAVGLHFPDIDGRFKRLIPPSLLSHRSILTHGMIASLLLFLLIRRRVGEATPLRLFAVGFSPAVAVHLCFDFFPKGWSGFALIHIPFYGWTTAFFSQAWIMLSIVACLCLGFLLVKNIVELVLGVVNLIISFAVSAVENGRDVLPAFTLLALATLVTIVVVRQTRKAAARRA